VTAPPNSALHLASDAAKAHTLSGKTSLPLSSGYTSYYLIGAFINLHDLLLAFQPRPVDSDNAQLA
jgi:hypothetical protein